MISLAAVAVAVLLHTGPACSSMPAHLDGSVDFRGDQWSVRLHVPAGPLAEGDSVSAMLDIADLIMTARPARLHCAQGAHVLQLPFGLGDVPLTGDSVSGYRGARSLGNDSLRVTLEAGGAPAYAVEEVRFRNGDIDLSGSLYIPHAPAPHPAIVMVHGSGAQGRGMMEYRSWGDFYARLGVATLVYDKRGVGASSGDFRADSAFVGLTGDALAAVAYLRSRGDIRARQVGLGGASQAGWIAYRAARDSAVAFLALLVPPSVSVAEQEIQRVRAGMRMEGLAAEAIDAAVAHTRLLFAVAGTGLGWDALSQSSHRVASEPWSEWVHRPESPDDLKWWRVHANIDPEDDIRSLRVPLFAAFSAHDPVVPSAQNAGVLRELGAGMPGHDITVVTASRGNHRLEVPAGRDDHGRWNLPRISRDVTDALTEWLMWRVGR